MGNQLKVPKLYWILYNFDICGHIKREVNSVAQCLAKAAVNYSLEQSIKLLPNLLSF
jgi:hypothetical protein